MIRNRIIIGLLACALAFFPPLASAQSPQVRQLLLTPQVVSAVAPYVGPGDVQSGALFWVGLRCYTNAYSGNVADITDSATGNTTGTRLQCNAGVVSALVSGSACTFVTGNACSSIATTCATACNILTLYDQSGNTNCSGPAACNFTQATNANRPKFTASCIGSLPCATFKISNSQSLSVVGRTAGGTLPQTMALVVNRNTDFSSFGGLAGDSSNNIRTFWTSAASTFEIGGSGATTATMSDSNLHSLQLLPGAAVANQLIVDNSLTTGSGAGGNAPFLNDGSTLTIGTASATFGSFIFGEYGVWNSGFNSTQLTNMCHNQHIYWSTPTSC